MSAEVANIKEEEYFDGSFMEKKNENFVELEKKAKISIYKDFQLVMCIFK